MAAFTRRVAQGRGGRLAVVLAILLLVLGTSGASAATTWSRPQLVGSPGACSSASAVIDRLGLFHVVAECSGRVRYSQFFDNPGWVTTTFANPGKTFDLGPQIAVDGNRIYIASTRYAPSSDTCGGPGERLGVYYRWRNLPSGSWSAPKRLGPIGDVLQSFRVVGGTLHATVESDRGTYNLIYETTAGGTLRRYPLRDSRLMSSLRIGSDGRARIAYEGSHGLLYAVFTGSAFSTSSIPGTSAADGFPVLVLDAHDKAHLIWSHEDVGCSNIASPTNGTYYATNASGTWTSPGSRKFTNQVGPTSLTIDVASGRVHAIVGGRAGVVYYTRAAGGSWERTWLSSAAASSAALKLDQSTGTLLAVYIREPGPRISSSVYAVVKRGS